MEISQTEVKRDLCHLEKVHNQKNMYEGNE